MLLLITAASVKNKHLQVGVLTVLQRIIKVKRSISNPINKLRIDFVVVSF